MCLTSGCVTPDKTIEASVVIIPAQPLPVETYAGEELRYHLEHILQRPVGLLSEADPTPKANWHFYLGRTTQAQAVNLSWDTLPANTCRTLVIGSDVIIAGGDSDGEPLALDTAAGTLLGVYTLLTEQLDVRWLWPGRLGEAIPSRKHLNLRSGSWRYTPPFEQALLNIPRHQKGWRSPECAASFHREQAVWLRRQRFSITVSHAYGHAFTDYWDRFQQDNRAVFNLLPDGTRRPSPLFEAGNPQRISLDLTSPSLHQRIIADWRAGRSAQRPWVNACANDSPGQCICEDCLLWDSRTPLRVRGEVMSPVVSETVSVERARRAYRNADPHWYRYLGSLSDRYARFYLTLLEQARLIDPHAKVVGEAYANRREPPVATQLNPDIIIRIVPAVMFPWTQQKQRDFFAQWRGWQATGATLMLRPNYLLDGHTLPIFYAQALAQAFRYAERRGMTATFFDSLTGQWATQGPNLYLLARLHQDPKSSSRRILNEYYAAFGPAQSAVRDYFRYWRQVSEAVRQEDYHSDWLHFLEAAVTIFTPQVMARADRLLERAEKRAAQDALAAERTAFLRLGLTHAQLCLESQRAWQSAQEQEDWQRFKKVRAALDTFRGKHETEHFADLGFLHFLEENYTQKHAAFE